MSVSRYDIEDVKESVQKLKLELIELKAFAEAHHTDQPSYVWFHGLTVDIPSRLDYIIARYLAKS